MRLFVLLLAALLPATGLAAIDEALRQATAREPAVLVAHDDEGKELALELRAFRPFSRDAKFVLVGADGKRRSFTDDTRYYAVQGRDDASLRGIFTLRADGRARGLVRNEDGFAWLQLRSDRSLQVARVAQPKDESAGFQCDNSDSGASALQRDEPALRGDLPAGGFEPPDGYRARIAIETDSEFLALFGNDVADATAYVGTLIGFVSNVYQLEIDTRMEVSFLRLWETPDPFVQTTTGCTLLETGKYWNDNEADVERSTMHFLSGRLPRAGVAWIGVMCGTPFNVTPAHLGYSCAGIDNAVGSNYGGAYGVTMGLTGGFDAGNPQVVWDLYGVAHELGHNFDSPHTHCYNGIGGNAAPVDTCHAGENGCWMGTTGLPGPQGVGSGTIMSYCHLRPGSLGNISMKLGNAHPFGVEPERVPSRMFDHVQSRAAGNAACLIEPVAQAALSMSATPDALAVGGTSALETSGGSGTGAVSFAVSEGATRCSVDGTTLTALAAGTCEVTATKAGDSFYLPATASVEITIRALQVPLAIATTPPSPVYGDTAQVEVIGGSGSGALTLALAPGSAACTLDGTTLQAVGIGACTLTAGKAGDTDYVAAEATLPLTIGRAPQSPLVLSATPASIAQGGSSTLSVAGGSGDGTPGLSVTAGSALCSLDGTTLTATATSTGICTVTATKTGGSFHLPASTGVDIGVFAPAIDLGLDIARIAPPAGDTTATAYSYRVSVTNFGPVAAPGIQLEVEASSGLLDLLWSCNAPPSCQPPAGSQSVDTQFDLAIGGSVQVEVSGEIGPGEDYVVIDARVLPGTGMTSLTPTDDTHRFVDGIGALLFGDSFE